MPDITMCKGDGCPVAERCYRAQATPTPQRQSYFVQPPFRPVPSEEHGICDHFIDCAAPVGEATDAQQ